MRKQMSLTNGAMSLRTQLDLHSHITPITTAAIQVWRPPGEMLFVGAKFAVAAYMFNDALDK
ncbi:hypothetical protein PIB30_113461, partial [Stylosanthes scabra]|nr:hypothetical protein [Stylosanthes scabra]